MTLTDRQVHLSLEEAQALCEQWQDILNLQHWRVKLKIARGNGLDLPDGTQGRCEWVIKKRSALIRLLDPIDWDKTCLWPQDMEQTLVHELLHLHFAAFDIKDDSPEDIASEQTIEALSRALVCLKRQNQPPCEIQKVIPISA